MDTVAGEKDPPQKQDRKPPFISGRRAWREKVFDVYLKEVRENPALPAGRTGCGIFYVCWIPWRTV